MKGQCLTARQPLSLAIGFSKFSPSPHHNMGTKQTKIYDVACTILDSRGDVSIIFKGVFRRSCESLPEYIFETVAIQAINSFVDFDTLRCHLSNNRLFMRIAVYCICHSWMVPPCCTVNDLHLPRRACRVILQIQPKNEVQRSVVQADQPQYSICRGLGV